LSWRCSWLSVRDGSGVPGRSDSDRALQITELRAEVLEGRAAVLDARLDIYSVNFGEASRNFEAARAALHAANARLMSQSRTEEAKSLEAALTRIDEAQRLAGQLNQDANAVAADAAKILVDVLGVHGETLMRAVIGAHREINYVWQKDGAQ
jgi:hypothetical protein